MSNRESRHVDAIFPEIADLPGQTGINCTGRSTGETADLPGNPLNVSGKEYLERWNRMMDREVQAQTNRRRRNLGW